MYFDLTSEQYQFDDAAERLLADAVDLPAITSGGKPLATLRTTLDAKFAEMGVGAILVPEEMGGLGLGLLTVTALAERLGRHAAPTTALSGAVAAWLVAQAGDQGPADRWLAPLMSGEVSAAFAWCEEPGRWLPGNLRGVAGDPQLTRYHVADAEFAGLIVAPLADGLLFIDAADATKSEASEDDLDMTRPTRSVTFAPEEGTVIDASANGRLADALLILAAADAAGAGRRALEMTVEYAKVREQFDRPIGAFQGLKHQLADMAVDVDPLRFLCWRAAHGWDLGEVNGSRQAALTKAHATEMAVKTARAAVEAHGGIGYTWEYPLHLLLKRAMHDRTVLGTPIALRRRAAALGEQGWSY